MSKHFQKRPEQGFVFLVVLLVLGTLGLALWVAAQNHLRRSANARAQALQTRLDAELTHELRRLRASPVKTKSPQALRTQAHGNILLRGLKDLQTLEEQRRGIRRLAERRLSNRQRGERRELLHRLDRDIRHMRQWVRLLQSRVDSS